MKNLIVNIEKDSSGYSIYTVNEIFSGIGKTLLEARRDMDEQIRLYLEVIKEDGKEYPKYLDGDYKIVYNKKSNL